MRYFLAILLLIVSVAHSQDTLDVTLTWDAPTANQDGSPLTDLAGYFVFWGPSGGPYEQGMVQIPDPGAVTHVLTDQQLTYGQEYCFVATAYNEAGVQSNFSNEACATTPAKPGTPTNLSVTISFGAN